MYLKPILNHHKIFLSHFLFITSSEHHSQYQWNIVRGSCKIAQTIIFSKSWLLNSVFKVWILCSNLSKNFLLAFKFLDPSLRVVDCNFFVSLSSPRFSRIEKIPYQAPPNQLGPRKCTFWKNAFLGPKYQC